MEEKPVPIPSFRMSWMSQLPRLAIVAREPGGIARWVGEHHFDRIPFDGFPVGVGEVYQVAANDGVPAFDLTGHGAFPVSNLVEKIALMGRAVEMRFIRDSV
jgi:hypothetical protein